MGRAIKRITINALVDSGCLLTVIPLLITGLVFRPAIGGMAGEQRGTVSGITRFDWVNLHTFTGFAFATLPIIHLLLHWQFFRHIWKTLRGNAKEACTFME